jgi:hypothetical protein
MKTMWNKKVNIECMHKFCVICRKEWGPYLKKCCTQNSLVAIKRKGVFRKKIQYFAFDGRQLNDDDLATIRERERAYEISLPDRTLSDYNLATIHEQEKAYEIVPQDKTLKPGETKLAVTMPIIMPRKAKDTSNNLFAWLVGLPVLLILLILFKLGKFDLQDDRSSTSHSWYNIVPQNLIYNPRDDGPSFPSSRRLPLLPTQDQDQGRYLIIIPHGHFFAVIQRDASGSVTIAYVTREYVFQERWINIKTVATIADIPHEDRSKANIFGGKGEIEVGPIEGFDKWKADIIAQGGQIKYVSMIQESGVGPRAPPMSPRTIYLVGELASISGPDQYGSSKVVTKIFDLSRRPSNVALNNKVLIDIIRHKGTIYEIKPLSEPSKIFKWAKKIK